jgi:hypothetical protein
MNAKVSVHHDVHMQVKGSLIDYLLVQIRFIRVVTDPMPRTGAVE